MNKLNSGVSYNSGTSSETSETQSVEENQQSDSVTPTNTNTPPTQSSDSRIPKSWKRMKDTGQDKDVGSTRPPWRAVSISTLPKPDKNALLRAKLLDASRYGLTIKPTYAFSSVVFRTPALLKYRMPVSKYNDFLDLLLGEKIRLRATKTAVGIQTDIVPTKFMKEVSLGAQTDLILFKEVGMLTDGSYAKRRHGGEEYILTYSVPLMTDTIETVNVATQTLIPRLPRDAFLELCMKPYDPKLVQQCSDSEKKLLKQLAKIRKTIIPLTAKFNEGDCEDTNDNIKSIGSIMPLKSKETHPCTTFRSSLLKPTHLSWYFEYNNEFSCENKFHPYTITANKPWTSFVPISFRANNDIDLNLLLRAMDELIQESNCLADRIDEMFRNRNKSTMKPKTGLNQKANEFEPVAFEPPSEYWLPIIEEQEKVLDEIKSFKGAVAKKLEK